MQESPALNDQTWGHQSLLYPYLAMRGSCQVNEYCFAAHVKNIQESHYGMERGWMKRGERENEKRAAKQHPLFCKN